MQKVDLLTGTPMPQSYDDLRNLFNLSWKGIQNSFLTDSRLSSMKRGGVFVRTTKSELNLPKPNYREIRIKPGKFNDKYIPRSEIHTQALLI